MSGMLKVCDIDPNLMEELKKFRYSKSKTSNCIIMKIDTEKLMVKIDEIVEDISVDELQEMLPSHQPRYSVYSSEVRHSDGRVSYPLAFFFTTPRDCKPELQMMYAGTKLSLIKELSIPKSFEIRELDELTQEWYEEKMTKP